MTILLIDSMGHYATADITKKWDFLTGGVTIANGISRRGGPVLRFTSWGSYIRKMLSGTENAYVTGFAFRAVTANNLAQVVCSFYLGSTNQLELRIETSGQLSLYRAGTLLASSPADKFLIYNTYYYIELKATFANSISAGQCRVRVNTEDWINLAAGTDTQGAATSPADRFILGPILSAPSSVNYDFHDFYLLDQLGSDDNDLLGDCRVDPYLANADGTYTTFVPSTGTAHYALVDDATPNTTDYNDGINTGDLDSYQMADMVHNPANIFAVQALAAVHKDDAGTKSARLFTRSGGNNYVASNAVLGTSQTYLRQVHGSNPATGTAWTKAAVDALEVGVEVT